MYRPIYHFLPEKNWMNDPNGVCWFQGQYHLFYQHNPTKDDWGNIHWGHAVSEDCVHWRHMPIALYPSHELGELHCFSGSISVEGELPVLYYTSIGAKEDGRDGRFGSQQWCAVSHDGMESFQKWEGNPILKIEDHDGLILREWRDPYVFKREDGWYMVLGSVLEGKGAALLYYSPDQFTWKFQRVLHSAPIEKGRSWECPNYFKLGEKAVLVVSPSDCPIYFYGREEANHEFIPEGEGILDYSGFDGFYAPNSFEDNKGRRIMIGWLTEGARGELQIPGWKGVQSLPRVLTMESDGLHSNPLPELSSLRGACEKHENFSVQGLWKAGTEGKALEIQLVFEKAAVKDKLQLQVFADPSGEEKTVISFEKETDRILIDRTNSNRTGKTSSKELSCAVAEKDGKVCLDVFLDYSTLEVFVSGKEVISTRVYPDREDSCGVYLNAVEASVDKMAVYVMENIWETAVD